MTTLKNAANQLKKKITDHKKVLVEIVKIAIELLDNPGKETYCNKRGYHTHFKRELIGFDGFDIRGDFGQSSMGGNELYISYHTGHPSHESGVKITLGVRWQCLEFDVDTCTVNIFDDNLDWQNMLRELHRVKQVSIAKYRRQVAAVLGRSRRKKDYHEMVTQLGKEAERLGLK